MTTDTVSLANKEVVRRVFEDSINRGKLELLDELVAEDYAGAQAGPANAGRAGFVATFRALHDGFPDIHYDLQDLVAEADRVTVRWEWKGTHRGTFRGPGGVYPATGTQVTNAGIAVFRVDAGKLRRGWLQTDRLGFLQQIGALPKPQ